MKTEMFQRKYHRGHHSLGTTVAIFACLLTVSLALLVLPVNGGAKDWPTKQITIIVPWAPGASTDMTPRTLGPKMSKILGVPIQVVNKPGGSGIIGTLEAVKAPPDGYTLLMDCGGTSSIQAAWSENLPYKVEERSYIARVIAAPLVLIVPATSPFKTVEDLVQAHRTNPAGITFGVIGGTGVPDVDIAQFRAAMVAKGIDISKTRPVAYKGSGEVGPASRGRAHLLQLYHPERLQSARRRRQDPRPGREHRQTVQRSAECPHHGRGGISLGRHGLLGRLRRPPRLARKRRQDR